jgi:hypothetical protein
MNNGYMYLADGKYYPAALNITEALMCAKQLELKDEAYVLEQTRCSIMKKLRKKERDQVYKLMKDLQIQQENK